MTKTNPLQALVSDDSINQEKLAEILAPHVSFTSKGQISFSPTFLEFDNKQKVLVSLLAIKGRSSLFNEYLDRSGPSEISKMTAVKVGSVKPTLTQLLSENLVSKDKDGYFIPNHFINFLKNRLENKND